MTVPGGGGGGGEREREKTFAFGGKRKVDKDLVTPSFFSLPPHPATGNKVLNY